MLDALRRPPALHDGAPGFPGGGQPGLDVADAAVQFGDRLREASAMRASAPLSPCTSGAPTLRATSGSKTAGSSAYSTWISRQGIVGERSGVGDDGGDALADEPHGVVEDVRVVGIVVTTVVPGRRERDGGAVTMRQHQSHARNRLRRSGVDRRDARVR